MATATSKTRTVVEVEEVTLVLTAEEARQLRHDLGAGHIFDALTTALAGTTSGQRGDVRVPKRGEVWRAVAVEPKPGGGCTPAPLGTEVRITSEVPDTDGDLSVNTLDNKPHEDDGRYYWYAKPATLEFVRESV